MADEAEPSTPMLRSRPIFRPSKASSSSSTLSPPQQIAAKSPRTTSPDDELNPAPACLGLAISVFFVAIILYFASEPLVRPRLWSPEELSKHNATDEELPILLGILGSVFDVTKGRTHYGVGGAYHHFAGRDATRAFVSGNFTGDGLTDSVAGLSIMQIKSLVDWRSFYNKTYIYAGQLIGTYYDKNGNGTKELRKVEAKAKIGEKLLRQQQADEEKYPVCNSRWSEQHGGEVWCDLGYPRLVEKVGELPLVGHKSKRCACFATEELQRDGLQVYEGCSPHQSTCKVS